MVEGGENLGHISGYDFPLRKQGKFSFELWGSLRLSPRFGTSSFLSNGLHKQDYLLLVLLIYLEILWN